MNLIIEGCDCVGKTSIIKEFIKLNPEYKMIHCSNPKTMEDGRIQYIGIVNRLQHEDNLIYDRALLGECVYGPMFRGYYPEYMRDLEKEIPLNTNLILVTCHPDEIKKRFDGEFIIESDIPKIQDNFFKEWVRSNYHNKYIMDTTNERPESLARRVLK